MTKKRTLRKSLKNTPKVRVLKDAIKNAGGLVQRNQNGIIEKEIKVVEQQIGLSREEGGEDFLVGLKTHGNIELLSDAQISFSDGTSIKTSSDVGKITSIIAGDGLTGGGTSAQINLAVEVADSTISVASGGISVSEANLSGIPNGALSNSTVSGISLGSNLNNLTTGNGLVLNAGTTYNGSIARTLTVSGSDSSIQVTSDGISVNSNALTGSLIQSPYIRTINSKTEIVNSSDSTPNIIDFGTELNQSAGVVSGYSNGTFTIQDVGIYKVSVVTVLEAGASQAASNVSIGVVSVDGSNTSSSQTDVVSSIGTTAARLNLTDVYVQFTHATTRTLTIQIAFGNHGGGISASSDLGGFPALVEITKIT